MPTSDARVETAQARRYLKQLCQHANAISRHTGRGMHSHRVADTTELRLREVESSEANAVLMFDQGSCTIHAEAEILTLRVEADNAADLRRIEETVAADLERFGNRERLTVPWRSHDDSSTATQEPTTQ
ncbi:DUF2218 domain-containing protein [Actinopolymorpha pittospori]